MKFEHLIFDFDGTISDSYPLFVEFFHAIAEQKQLPFDLTDEELDRQLRQTLRKGYEAMGWEKLISYRDLLTLFREMQEKRAMKFQAFPEAIDLLQYAAKCGKKLYVYTHSGDLVNQMMKNMGIDSLFTFVLDASFGFAEKPSPDALLYLMQRFELKAGACLMIGDRPIDANAGMNAGMKGCLWDARELYPEAKADYVVRSLSEVKGLI